MAGVERRNAFNALHFRGHFSLAFPEVRPEISLHCWQLNNKKWKLVIPTSSPIFNQQAKKLIVLLDSVQIFGIGFTLIP
jgi:hypothetical protein